MDSVIEIVDATAARAFQRADETGADVSDEAIINTLAAALEAAGVQFSSFRINHARSDESEDKTVVSGDIDIDLYPESGSENGGTRRGLDFEINCGTQHNERFYDEVEVLIDA